MIQGHPLSAMLPEDAGLGERFWYWYGASGRRYIHSIYYKKTFPPVSGAVFVLVSRRGGSRRALSVGRFSTETPINSLVKELERSGDVEIHVHLLARDDEGAQFMLGDLLAAMNAAVQPAVAPVLQTKLVQLDLLAA